MTEATWGAAGEPPAINWRISAALENVPRVDSDVPEVTSLEEAVRVWLGLDLQHQTNATITPEQPIRLYEGEGLSRATLFVPWLTVFHKLAKYCRSVVVACEKLVQMVFEKIAHMIKRQTCNR